MKRLLFPLAVLALLLALLTFVNAVRVRQQEFRQKTSVRAFYTARIAQELNDSP